MKNRLIKMAGHSHWKQIQHKKSVVDQKRSKNFSKLLNAITIAAKKESNPQFNPVLRTAIEKAKQFNIPQKNIERAIQRAGGADRDQIEELLIEAFGPGGSALIITAITDNKNRTINEIKAILRENNGKIAVPGSARWNFHQDEKSGDWIPNFPQPITEPAVLQKIQSLIQALLNQDDVQNIYVNVKLSSLNQQ